MYVIGSLYAKNVYYLLCQRSWAHMCFNIIEETIGDYNEVHKVQQWYLKIEVYFTYYYTGLAVLF